MATKKEEHPHTTLIKNLMVKHNLYQRDVGDLLGLTQANINKGMRDPSSKTFVKIAQLFVEKYGEEEAQFAIDVFKESPKRDKDLGKTLAVLMQMTSDTGKKINQMARDVSELRRDLNILKGNIDAYQREKDLEE